MVPRHVTTPSYNTARRPMRAFSLVSLRVGFPHVRLLSIRTVSSKSNTRTPLAPPARVDANKTNKGIRAPYLQFTAFSSSTNAVRHIFHVWHRSCVTSPPVMNHSMHVHRLPRESRLATNVDLIELGSTCFIVHLRTRLHTMYPFGSDWCRPSTFCPWPR